MGDEGGDVQEPATVALFDDEAAEDLIRRVWHDGRWFFSVIDVVGALTDAPKPRMYWADMKRRIQAEGFRELLARCQQLKLVGAHGKSYETDCADFSTMMSLLFALPAWKRSMRRNALYGVSLDTCGSGIYAITNIITMDQYLGSSRDIPTRFNQHRSLLRQGKHYARVLQDAWNRHGEESFRFEILESVADTKNLEPLEQQYLSEYKPTYNTAPVASNSATAQPISAERFSTVLRELYAISGFGKSTPVFRTIRDAIISGALRPGPNFHLLLEAGNDAVRGCEELSAFTQHGQSATGINRKGRRQAMSDDQGVVSPENYRALTTQSDHNLWSQNSESAPALPAAERDDSGE